MKNLFILGLSLLTLVNAAYATNEVKCRVNGGDDTKEISVDLVADKSYTGAFPGAPSRYSYSINRDAHDARTGEQKTQVVIIDAATKAQSITYGTKNTHLEFYVGDAKDAYLMVDCNED